MNIEAKKRFIDTIRETFNAGVKYKGLSLKRDTVIERKTDESGSYLTGKSRLPEFTEPALLLETVCNSKLRSKILDLDASEAEQLGMGKSTLRNARTTTAFKIYRPVLMRLRGFTE